MLNFSNITPTGYTITTEIGDTEVVTGKIYNNETGTAHLYRSNNILYELYLDHYYARTDKTCHYYSLIPSNEWIIYHNFSAGIIVHVIRSDGLMVYPKNVLLIDMNTVKLNFDTQISGKAVVRVT